MDHKVRKGMHNMVRVMYLQVGEPSKILSESSLIIFTKSRLNLKPEKLHSEGKANKLYVSPALGKIHHKAKVSLKYMNVSINFKHISIFNDIIVEQCYTSHTFLTLISHRLT